MNQKELKLHWKLKYNDNVNIFDPKQRRPSNEKHEIFTTESKKTDDISMKIIQPNKEHEGLDSGVKKWRNICIGTYFNIQDSGHRFY